MKRLYLKLLAIVTVLLMGSGMKAQVTVGAGLEPNNGAILDIKEYNPTDLQTDNTTATKGMLLPRVSLTDMSNLYPMFLGNTDYENNTNAKKDKEDEIHTGLVVYNIHLDFCEEVYPGTYVWDGHEWSRLTDEYPFPGETDILIDNRDPNKIEQYKIGKFGNAGWWMLENLRAEKWPDGTDGVYREPPKDRPVYNANYYNAMYWYPGLNENFMNTQPELGYVYNGWAALRTTWDEMLVHKPTTGVQGICPTGWHVPTVDEWTELRQAVYDNPCLYAHSKINENVDYNIIAKNESSPAKSRSMAQGGFNAHLLGYVYGNPTRPNPNPTYPYLGQDDPANFPEIFPKLSSTNLGLMWASDTTTDPINPANQENLWGFTSYIDGTINLTRFGRISYSTMIPVRCKKDVTRKSTISATKMSSESFIDILSE